MKRPAFMFYPADWRKDPELRVCSIAARGLWIDMLALMHEGAPYGHLIVNGAAVTAAQLARLVGESAGLVTKLLAELESHHVFSRTDADVIYSRRMVQDEQAREVRAAGGKLGGNPTLLARPKVKQKDNHEDNQPVKGRSKVKPTLSVAVAVAGSDKSSSSPLSAADSAEPVTWLTPYMAAWLAQYGGPMPVEPNVQALRWLEGKYGVEETVRRWTIYLAATRSEFASAHKLKAGWGQWSAAPVPGVRGSIGVAPAILGEAATLWERYKAAALLSKLPREEYDRIGNDLVQQGLYPSVAAMIAELRITQPWTLDARTDGYAINELARRLSTPQKVSA